jgi:uncharacterized protein (TIGR04255 family)
MESNPSTPVKLTKIPIVESTFEVRFVGKQKQLGDLLPGLLFKDFGKEFSNVTRLPTSEIPRAFVAYDPQLAYQPLQSMDGNGKRLLIGDQAVALSFIEPYPGWASFRAVIIRLVRALKDTTLIDRVERFSLRYVNILEEGKNVFDRSQLKLKLSLADLPLRDAGLQLQVEIESNGCVSVVQLHTGAKITLKTPTFNATHQGLMLAVDTIMQANLDNFLDDCDNLLDTAHRTEKQIFFALLSQETLSALGPKWEQQE